MARMKKVGFLNSASLKELALPIAAFRNGMKQAGADKKTAQVTYKFAKHDLEKLPELAQDLVESGIDILAATGGIAAAQAAVDAVRASGKPIRVVFVAGFDPSNMSLPGGPAIGIHTDSSKALPERLKLAEELLGNRPMAMLVRKDTTVGDSERSTFARIQSGDVHEAGSDKELRAAFKAAGREREAVIVSADPFYTSNRQQVVRLAKSNKVPAIYAWREFVEAGGLISFGCDLSKAYRQAGVYVGRMLADPNYRPSVPALKGFDIAINLKTAKALKIQVPDDLLARADHIVG